MDQDTKARIAGATVRLSALGGRGVLVPGGMIITAAHCIRWSNEGDMGSAGEEWREKLEDGRGHALMAAVLAVESVADIAILGAVDEQGAPEQARAFEAF